MYDVIEVPDYEKAILVGVVFSNMKRSAEEESLHELSALAETAGARTVAFVIQARPEPDPATLIGRGKVTEIKERAADLEAKVVIFDADLSPVQVKNLEKMIDKKIVDRSGLILDIFARRAKSHESQIQVELAQLQYLYPRLTRAWSHLSRQVGGIGTRGPGETQLEVDRRLVRKRIDRLRAELNKIENQRENRRKGRTGFKKAALVGYTNVGKSSLMNALAEVETFVEDQLFATLDATIRDIGIPDIGKILLIDTVGFIQKLPHHLVASFRSTLEESMDADVLLHVVDVSHSNFEEQMLTVRNVLNDMEAHQKATITVFNKIDQLKDRSLIASLQKRYYPAVFTSAKRGIGLKQLKDEIASQLKLQEIEETVRVPQSASKVISDIYHRAKVLDCSYEENDAIIRYVTSPENAAKIQNIVQRIESS